jgi:gamma-glutamyltranspeptidase/glutathione hydrolase
MISACQSTESEPEAADRGDEFSKGMVVTANPHASRAGAEILRAGGSAVDAAIAIEAVLSLVEPQSSGLAGGAFMMYYDAQSQEVSVYDGRETAPASATPEMFILPDGSKMGFLAAKNSGVSTGVPGMISMLKMAHSDHGTLPWGPHFETAKGLASNGFEVSPRLHGMIKRFGKYIPKTEEQGQTKAYKYFHTNEDEPLPVGHLLKNPEYATALELIAKDPMNFYSGSIAQEIVNAVAIEPRAGRLQMSDLLNYSAVRRTALCTPYKQLELCGPPPPSSWVGVAMMMGILERAQPFSNEGAKDPANWAKFGESQRLAYADRDQYVADPDSVIVPIKGMLNEEYLAQRAALISTSQAAAKVSHGDPWAFNDSLPSHSGLDATDDTPGTTHFVVVDQQGNIVSMTASVESIFGSTRMVGGMFLNNQLTDFSFLPRDDSGKAMANAVASGKRPRSSMSPTIVLNGDREFVMATGSPGGNSILAYTAKTLVGVLEWGLTPSQAVALPNMVGRGDKVRIESERASPELVQGLRDYGFNVKESAGENSGLSVVLRHSDGRLEGGVDPRREGIIVTVD